MIVEILRIFQDELLNPHLGGITLEKHENNGRFGGFSGSSTVYRCSIRS